MSIFFENGALVWENREIASAMKTLFEESLRKWLFLWSEAKFFTSKRAVPIIQFT